MVRSRADDTYLDSVLGIPPGEGVHAVKFFPRIQVVDGTGPIDVEHLFINRNIHRAPPDIVLRIRVLDDSLVRW